MTKQFPPNHIDSGFPQFGCFGRTELTSATSMAVSFNEKSLEIEVLLDDAPAGRENRDSSIGPGLHELAEAIKTVPAEVRAEIHNQKLAYQRGFLDGTLSAGVMVGILLTAAFVFRGKPSALGERRI
jgi:hypothetical protein